MAEVFVRPLAQTSNSTLSTQTLLSREILKPLFDLNPILYGCLLIGTLELGCSDSMLHLKTRVCAVDGRSMIVKPSLE